MLVALTPQINTFVRRSVLTQHMAWSGRVREKISECCRSEISGGMAKEIITKALKEENPERSRNIPEKSRGAIDSYYVSNSGSIITYNREYDILLIMEPVFIKDNLVWKCVVNPSPEGNPSLCSLMN